ncbi:MAG TPA: NADP-dependent oxidoreductase [Dehalococcoidia bacterium]|nr:NADP-dependent oxidoreductase [Dehalococcoidia bacterium]
MPENRQVMIASVPAGPLAEGHFETRSSPVPDCSDGEVLCRTVALTIGAGQRAGLQGSASYAGAPQSGVVMGGAGVARVESSKSPSLSPGDLVVAPTGWQEYSAHAVDILRKVDASLDPALHLGALGTNGLTAYFGLLEVGRPSPGETVVVSAAAGSVGHIVGQLAKLQQCRVVGIAGSDEKCRTLVDELGFDAAVNYKDQDFRAAFKAATPDRIDIYFDNTGGDILGSALFRMNLKGRIVCCGVVSQYDTDNPGPGPRGVPGLLVNNRVRMEGFLVFDYLDRYDEARDKIASWVQGGDLLPWTTEHEGLEAAPRAFVELLAGVNIGTTIVRIS